MEGNGPKERHPKTGRLTNLRTEFVSETFWIRSESDTTRPLVVVVTDFD
jgi:hypothetical protein